MKRTFLPLLLIFCLLLTGCAPAGPVQTQDSQPAASTDPVQTVPPSTETDPVPSDPFSAPPISISGDTVEGFPWIPLVTMSPEYEEYFSQEKEYTLQDLSTDVDLKTPEAGLIKYYLAVEDGNLVLLPEDSYSDNWVIGPVSDYAGCRWYASSPLHYFGVRDGREILCLDLQTGQTTVLYTDETGVLGELVAQEAQPLCLADDRVLFFLAGAGENVGIYRLYLSTGQIDCLYDEIPRDPLPLSIVVYSNYAVGWQVRNPEFEALVSDYDRPDQYRLRDLYQQAAARGELPDYEDIRSALLGDIMNQRQKYPILEYYYNSVTGELYTLPLGEDKLAVGQLFHIHHWEDCYRPPEDLTGTAIPEEEWQEILDVVSVNDGTYGVASVAFDPIGTYALVQALADEDFTALFGSLQPEDQAIPSSWAQGNLALLVCRIESNLPGVDPQTVRYAVYRYRASDPWKADVTTITPATPERVSQAMTPDALEELGVENALGGYDLGDGSYYLFIQDPETGEVSFQAYSK